MFPQLHGNVVGVFVMHRSCRSRRVSLITIEDKMRFEGVEQRSSTLGENVQRHLASNQVVM